ncbi:MAG: hypothetical protein WAS36_01230 [Candidatus Saccharimonadales bacterium]
MNVGTALNDLNLSQVPFGKLSFIAAAVLLLCIIIMVVKRSRPQELDMAAYKTGWKSVEKKLKDESLWALAIIEADDLLASALKTRRYKGRNMGERLVSAQRDIADNPNVWFAHKLKKRIAIQESPKLKKKEVKTALLGLRGALRDIGALK